MKKIFLAVLLFSVTSSIIYAVNITTLDGTEYKDAQVLSRTPNGIVIECIKKGGFTTVKLLRFSELSGDIQKKYGYNSKKSGNYEKKQQAWINAKQAKDLAILNKNKEQENKAIATETKYNNMVQSKSFMILFKSIAELNNGSVGWASQSNQNGSPQQMGKIFLLNKAYSGGMQVNIQVVATNKKVTYFKKEIPCYFAVQ